MTTCSMTCRNSSRSEWGGLWRVPVGIHPCISISRGGWGQSLPWQLLRCLLLSSCLMLRAHHNPSTLSRFLAAQAASRG